MRRPGENPVSHGIASVLGRLLRHRRAGDAHSIGRALPAQRTFSLSSPAFEHGEPIPDVHAGTGRGANRSPALSWGAVPDGTAQLLLVMEDTDVPLARPILHLGALLPPTVTSLEEGELTPDRPGIRYLPGRGGRAGYHGPRALPGHGVHHYDLYLFALDRAISDDTAVADVDALIALARGHVLARGHLQGTQEA